MTPLAQINLTELPFRPPRLDDLEFITVFIDPKSLGNLDKAKTWCLRAYPHLDALASLTPPQDLVSVVKAFPMRAQIIDEDFPVFDDVAGEIPDELEDTYIDDFDNTSGFKMGGWPTLIQSEIFWAPFNRHPAEPEYIFQIDSTSKGNWSWGDGGVGYFGRGTKHGRENEWTLEWQCF